MNEKAHIQLLEDLYKQYQPMLVSFAYNYLRSAENSKEVVQEVFIGVWNNRTHLRLDGNLKSYLFTATKNKCLNFLEKRRLKTVSLDTAPGDYQPEARLSDNLPDSSEMMEVAELRSVIFDEVSKLPPKCQQIFLLSRKEQLSYKEIAAQLTVSTKTVENQIGIALKRIRKRVFAYQNQDRGSLGTAAFIFLWFCIKILPLLRDGTFFLV